MRWCVLMLGLSAHLSAASFDHTAPSTPDEIASLNVDLIVDGFVSAMSGQLALSEVDLHIKGAQDLILKRTYVPPQILGRYSDKNEKDKLKLGAALQQLHTKGWIVLPHLWAGTNYNSYYFQVRDPQGYVLEFDIRDNRGILKSPPYGCSNLRGGEASSAADIRNIELLVVGNQVHIIWPDGIKRIYVYHKSGYYRLESELLPNGKTIQYQYTNGELSRIVSTDANFQYTYAYLDQVGKDHYRGSDGREVKLTYEMREIRGKLQNGKYKQEAMYQFPVMTKAANPVYNNTVGYSERTLLTSYDTKAYRISASYYQQRGEIARIQTFSTPSGRIALSYDPPIAGYTGGSTTVSYPDGAVVTYRFNSSLLLTHLENWFEGKLYNQKTFTYDHKQHLSKVETKDDLGNTLLTKIYECDISGNPILETHIGDFGTFTTKRSFSKNRLVTEIRDDGLGYEYTYLGDTHLTLSKTTLANGQPIRSILYTHDDANNLIEKQEEGKTVTTYHLYEHGPYLHRTHLKEEKDWDGHLIHKTEYIYDPFGNTSQENHYGSDEKFAYTIERTYDEKGNLLEETNPLGQKVTYTYDARSRQIKEVPFSNRLTIDRTFDAKGRLTFLKEGDHATHLAYNTSDELIKKVDYLGLTTNYAYHPVHGKPTHVEAEPTLQTITYDVFGREIERKDAYGASTKIKLNSYGDPLEIIYPDGGKKTFTYASNGLLLEEVNPDGLQTSYSYDPLGRMLSKKIGDYETTYTYDAYRLIEEKDPLGISTFYTYNLAGQKIKEEKAGIVTEFTYDPLGFLASEIRSSRKISFQNDVLGRVVLKDIDGVLKTAYTYDPAGNIDSISKGNPICFTYDPYDRLIEKIDAEGATTTICYEEGGQGFIKRITDPRGVESIETYNAHELLLKREIPGVTIETFDYDKALRLISQDHLTFTYTPEGFLSSMCEAGKRTTYWTYTPGGKVASKQKPDGTLLHYDYNSQGNLAQVGSRKFTYDAMGRLIAGTGFKRRLDPFGNIFREEFGNDLALNHTYDDWDRPTKRTLPDDSQILYAYEGPFLKTVTRIDRNGSSRYTHTYEEFNAKGNPLLETGIVTTAYTYDKSGRRIYQKSPYFEETLKYDPLGNLLQKGDNQYTCDEASQLTSETDQFTASYDKHYNCIQKNGEEIYIDDLNQRSGTEYDLNGNLLRPGFVYDEFDQLILDGHQENVYDALGRRLSSGSTSYFYIEEEEIGSYEKDKILELKVLGSASPIAIEIEDRPFAPIVDVQNTIRQLIDWESGEVAFQNTCDAFGNGVTEAIPYAYVGKRYDASTGLIYFGKRFYDPGLGRWLTPDPIGAVDHSNLYQYVFNNPHLYRDINGEFAILLPLLFWGAELALPAISVYVTAIAYGTATGVIAYGGYKLVEAMNERDYPGAEDYYSGGLIFGSKHLNWTTKNGSVDPSLPANPDDLLERPDWKETTHPEAGKKGHRTFENEKTGEKLRHDEGKPWATGHKAHDHYHRPNPTATGKHDEYLDGRGNPTRDQSDPSHIYPPEGAWWN